MSAPAADRVVRLGGAVRAELLRRQVRFDAKPLRAHVTLARVRDGASDDEARAIAAAVTAARLDGLAFRADEVQVVESTLSSRVPPGGSRVPPGGSKAPLYSSRARIPLAGPSR
jgi:2'-5' RNA ligase